MYTSKCTARQTCVVAMWIILISLLPCFCGGVDVELAMTPSVVTEGESLTLTCSTAQKRSSFASFNFANWTRIGIAKLLGGSCIPTVRSTGQVCEQQCSCNTNGTSFSWTVLNVTGDWNNTRVRCYMVIPDVTKSDLMVVNVLSPSTGTQTLISDPMGNVSTNAVIIICVSSAIVVVAVVAVAVFVFYCRKNKLSCFSKHNGNQENAMTEQTGADKGANEEQCQYEDLNHANVAPPSEYEDIDDQEQRKSGNDSGQNTYEILGRTSAPDVYDELIHR